MHHDYWQPVRDRLAPGSLIMLNTSVFTADIDRGRYTVVDIPASSLAADAGNIVAATMVMTGAYAGATRLVSVESLVAAVGDALPAYRSQHIALNQAAIRAGAAAGPRDIAPAWSLEEAAP
jgi:2-oxoglutarate ferredoxin oxidoreductase subunit gamma